LSLLQPHKKHQMDSIQRLQSEVECLRSINHTKQKLIDSYERQVDGLLLTIQHQSQYIQVLRQEIQILKQNSRNAAEHTSALAYPYAN